MPRAALILTLLLFVATPGRAATIHVPGDQPTIQAGIDAAQDGDVIELANGNFEGVGNRDLMITGKSITIRSASGNAAACVIDSRHPDYWVWTHGIAVVGAETQGTVLEHLTIANAQYQLVFSRGDATAGIGVSLTDTSVEIRGVIFLNCESKGVHAVSSHVILGNCELRGGTPQWSYGVQIWQDGTAVVNECVVSGFGVGIAAWRADVTVNECSVVRNAVGFEAGSSTGTITGSTISLNNGNSSFGGGMTFRDSSFEVEDSVIEGNSYPGLEWAGWRHTGGVGLSGSSHLTMTNCRVTGNRTALVSGAGVSGESPAVLIADHCVFAGNHGQNGGGIAGSLEANLTNSIVWGNCAAHEGDELYLEAGSAVRFECSDVDTSGIAGPGSPTWLGTNLFTDPEFCEPEDCLDSPTDSGYYTLHGQSPAYDHPVCGRIGLLNEGCEIAVTPDTWARIKARYR